MSESKEHKEGSCCKPNSSCCSCKKFFVGILTGVLIAMIAHCFLCSAGSHCGKAKMCPIVPQAQKAVQ